MDLAPGGYLEIMKNAIRRGVYFGAKILKPMHNFSHYAFSMNFVKTPRRHELHTVYTSFNSIFQELFPRILVCLQHTHTHLLLALFLWEKSDNATAIAGASHRLQEPH